MVSNLILTHYHSHCLDVLDRVHELAYRLIYELIHGIIDHRHIINDSWINSHLRDNGHDKRIMKLVYSILHNETSYTHLQHLYPWITIDLNQRGYRSQLI